MAVGRDVYRADRSWATLLESREEEELGRRYDYQYERLLLFLGGHEGEVIEKGGGRAHVLRRVRQPRVVQGVPGPRLRGGRREVKGAEAQIRTELALRRPSRTPSASYPAGRLRGSGCTLR